MYRNDIPKHTEGHLDLQSKPKAKVLLRINTLNFIIFVQNLTSVE